MERNLLFNQLTAIGKRLAMVLTMLLTLGIGNAWAEEVTFSGDDIRASFNYGNNYKEGTFTSDGFSIYCSSGYGNTAAQFRVAKSATLTINSTVGNITKVIITVTGTSYKLNANNISWSSTTGTYSNAGGVQEITFTNSDANIARISKIAITYDPSSVGGGDPTPSTTYTIKWHTAVGITTDDILNEGETITQPATDPTMSGYVFMGWTEDCEVASDGAGFTAISNFGTATEDKDYYAVFAIATNPSGGGATETTASVKIQNYASANSWANSTKYTSVKIDENITASVSGSSNTGKYYTSGHEWRLYQTESAKLTISATEGKTIKTAKITYNVSNTGVLKLNSSNVTSGTISTINASSVTYNVGNSGSATNGQVKVTAIEVVYTSGAGGGGTTTYDNYITTCTAKPTN